VGTSDTSIIKTNTEPIHKTLSLTLFWSLSSIYPVNMEPNIVKISYSSNNKLLVIWLPNNNIMAKKGKNRIIGFIILLVSTPLTLR
jgi:hypothetical protein